jgi:chromosome segregation ATPase
MLPTNPRTARTATLRAEVEALEAEQKGQTDPTQSTEVKEEESSSEVTEVIAEQKEVKETKEEVVQDLQYWKDRSNQFENRWKVSKAKYDSNIFKMKQENLSLKNVNIEVKKKLNQVLQAQAASKPSKLDEVFGEEQVDVLGQSTVDVIKNTIAETNKRVDEQEAKAKEDQLAREEQELKDEYNKEYNGFISRIEKLVPDLKKLNTDKGFLEWLKEPDDFSGDLREDILAKAESSRDVGRVAKLFLQYKPKKAPAQDSVSKRIAPSNTEGSVTTSSIEPKDTIPMAQVDKFYDDVARGKYKGRYTEKKTMEAKIDKAWASGRIT